MVQTCNTVSDIEMLNAICDGWTEDSNGCLENLSNGAAIDITTTSRQWFVVFCDQRPAIRGLATRNDAIKAFVISSIEKLKTKKRK